MSSPFEQSDDLPVYVISVAAELAGMHPQTLREYDRLGLVSPGRSRRPGPALLHAGHRWPLREVQRLSQEEGVNLAGVKRILDQLRRLTRRQSVAELRAEIAQLRAELESTRRRGGRGWPGCTPAAAAATNPGSSRCGSAAPGRDLATR